MTEVEYWRIMVRLDELEAKLNALTALVRFPQGNIAYSAQTTNGDPTKFRSGSISSKDGYNINDPAESNQRPTIPPKAPPEVKR